MTQGSLFSGFGGFDLSSEWMGWKNVFHCEIEEFPRTILKYYWPNAISYEDIRKTDFTIHRGQIDVLTGGFPCQPYSVAGKRKGKEDNRHLWPEMLRAIREIQPSWIVGENVPGIISWNGGLVFEEVCADLENEGYEIQPVILPAISKDAPHKRNRVWFVANRADAGVESVQSRGENGAYGFNSTTDSIIQRCDHRSNHREKRQVQSFKVGGDKEGQSEWNGRINRFRKDGSIEFTSDTNSERFQKQHSTKESKEQKFDSWRYLKDGNYWENFPTQSPICSGNDGISTRLDGITFPEWRNESIKGFGNAVVPQVVYEIFKVIEQLNK